MRKKELLCIFLSSNLTFLGYGTLKYTVLHKLDQISVIGLMIDVQ